MRPGGQELPFGKRECTEYGAQLKHVTIDASCNNSFEQATARNQSIGFAARKRAKQKLRQRQCTCARFQPKSCWQWYHTPACDSNYAAAPFSKMAQK